MEKELEQCRGYICTPDSWLLGQQMYSMDFPSDVGKGGCMNCLSSGLFLSFGQGLHSDYHSVSVNLIENFSFGFQ